MWKLLNDMNKKNLQYLDECDKLEVYREDLRDEINRLEDHNKKMQSDIYLQEDEIDMQHGKLLEEIKQKLNGRMEVDHIMMISIEIV